MEEEKKVKRTLDELPEILLVADIQEYLEIGEQAAYDLVKSEKFRVIRIGRLYKIPKKGFVAWLEGKAE